MKLADFPSADEALTNAAADEKTAAKPAKKRASNSKPKQTSAKAVAETAETSSAPKAENSARTSAPQTKPRKGKSASPATQDLLPSEDELQSDEQLTLLTELPDEPPVETDEYAEFLDEPTSAPKAETAPTAPAAQTAPTQTATQKEDSAPEKAEKEGKRGKRKKKEPVDPLAGIERFAADPEKGLTEEQVDLRCSQGLVNRTPTKYSKTYKSIFLGNICSVFNLLCLICAVALTFAHAPYTQYVFVVIFLCNIVISIIQEIRAKRTIDRLSILSSLTAKVIRGGTKVDLPVEDLVIDDILILSAGQQVPADCTVLSGHAEFNEALLTGESVAIKKEVGGELYAGSFVASGQVAARVDKIGDFTYISKLTAKAKKYKRPNSEIMNSISLFIRIIGIAIIPIAILMFFINFKEFVGDWSNLEATGGFWKTLFAENSKGPLSQTIQYTVGIIIGMIPSGLLLLTTVAMSVGIIRLTKYKTLVQDMYSLEMLARVNVLCLDKTGTITDGRMKVSDCVQLDNKSKYPVDTIIGCMLAALNDNNQTSIALFERFGHCNEMHPIAHLPFSSARKLSAVSFYGEGTYVMGAPEFVLNPLPVKVDKLVKQYAQMGLRVLLIAHSKYEIRSDKPPEDLSPVALITLTDNIRPDAIKTIKWFHNNDVDVKVISGDNPVTVAEVARRAGIKNAAKYVSLEGLSDPEVEVAASQYTVFGRVTPEQKAILIRAIKQSGNTVAMTGDGVNDILAMKEADCAISVASGSEAARNIANLVLQDNNFSSMPQIVNEGRRVINNVKNSASLYIMKTLLTLFLALICFFVKSPYFFTTQNLMVYEILVSALPSFVLSLQPNTNRVKGRFTPYVLSRAIPGALTMALSVLTFFVIFKLTSNGIIPNAFKFYTEETIDHKTIEYQALMILALTFTGLVMLYQLCRPFNPLRATLFTVCTMLCLLVFSIPHLGEVVLEHWNTIHFNLPQILLLIIVVQAALPVSAFLIKAFDMMNPIEDEEKSDEKEEEPPSPALHTTKAEPTPTPATDKNGKRKA